MKWARATICAAIAILVFANFGTTRAQEFKSITGEGFIGPSQRNSDETEIGFIFTGELAKRAYEHLPGTEKEDACTGGTMKSDVEGLFCLADQLRIEYKCSFGYIIGTRKVTSGPLSC